MVKIKSALESAASMRRKNLMLFDFEPHILCCENGVVNLRTVQFRRSCPSNSHDLFSVVVRITFFTERYKEDEFRGALTHLREISPSEVERVIRRFTDSSEFLKLKCLLNVVCSVVEKVRYQ